MSNCDMQRIDNVYAIISEYRILYRKFTVQVKIPKSINTELEQLSQKK